MTASRSPPPPTPLTVVGGFLGSGKTSLVNALLAGGHGLRLGVLVNDFGAVDVDAGLIARHDGRTLALSNGCVCCSIAGNLATALMDLRRETPPFDRVVIEASGVADPRKIAQIGMAGGSFALDGIVVLADAEAVRARARDRFVADTVLRQLAAADLLVVNKRDLVGAEEARAVRAWLGQVAPTARRYETCHGRVPPGLLFDTEMASIGDAHPMEAGLASDRRPDHLAGLRRWTVAPDGPLDRARLEAALRSLPPGILRAKGFVRLAGEADWRLAQAVGSRWSLAPAPPRARATGDGVLVLIGHDDAETRDRMAAWAARL